MMEYEIWHYGSHLRTSDKYFARDFLEFLKNKENSLDVRGPDGDMGKTCIPEEAVDSVSQYKGGVEWIK